jgi:hypothetical protein
MFGHEAMPVMLHLKMAIGATGAPTLDEKLSKGIASVVRDSAGQYTITLEDRYTRLMHLSVDQRDGTDPVAAPLVQVEADNSADATPTIVVQYRDAADAATDPGDGEEQNMLIILSNSSVGN